MSWKQHARLEWRAVLIKDRELFIKHRHFMHLLLACLPLRPSNLKTFAVIVNGCRCYAINCVITTQTLQHERKSCLSIQVSGPQFSLVNRAHKAWMRARWGVGVLAQVLPQQQKCVCLRRWMHANSMAVTCVCFFFSSFSISCQNSGFQLNIQKIISVANRFSLMVMGNVLK